jgi:transcriptional regulator with XRE-family HTH domain
MTITMNAGRLLRSARARAGLTQRDLAGRTGVPQPTIAAIESGAQDPRYKTLYRLVRACGQDLDLVRHGGEGEDVTLLRENLRLTPAERLAKAQQGARMLELLRSARRVS